MRIQFSNPTHFLASNVSSLFLLRIINGRFGVFIFQNCLSDHLQINTSTKEIGQKLYSNLNKSPKIKILICYIFNENFLNSTFKYSKFINILPDWLTCLNGAINTLNELYMPWKVVWTSVNKKLILITERVMMIVITITSCWRLFHLKF